MRLDMSSRRVRTPGLRRPRLELLCALLATSPAFAAEYYVAPDGDDGNTGTQQAPFETVTRGQQVAAAGDTVWVRGGTYTFTSGTVGVAFTKPGQAGKPIRYFAYPGETPVFDLSAINPTGRVTGFDIHTNYLHLRGMVVTGVPQYQSGQDSWGLRIQGSNNVVEQMNVHHNEAPGIFITSGANNLILNCDSHHNYDVLEGGGSGDGFGCHSTGDGNVLRGCRAWSNSDDGYDFINAPGVCSVEQSWAWRNGWVPDTNTGAGNGAGFKAGGFGLDTSTFPAAPPVHVVQQCLAWKNRSQGFYANHHPGALHFFSNTAYDNPKNFDLLDDVGPGAHVLRNNVVFGAGGTVTNSTNDDIRSNSWNGGVNVSQEDFQSVDDALATGPRQSDGSLPNLAFLHLAPESDLVDAGEDVGLPFAGVAPDLGAFETGTGEVPVGPEPAPTTSSGASDESTTVPTLETTSKQTDSSGEVSSLAPADPTHTTRPSHEEEPGSSWGETEGSLSHAPAPSAPLASTPADPNGSSTLPNATSGAASSGPQVGTGGEQAEAGNDGCACSFRGTQERNAWWCFALFAVVSGWVRRRMPTLRHNAARRRFRRGEHK